MSLGRGFPLAPRPAGWAATTLGEIGVYLNGRGFKKSEWRESGRPIIRIQNLTGSGDRFNYFDGEAEERHVAREGDLLVSWAATLGVFEWHGPEAVINQHIFKVESRIDRRFHRYLLLATLAALERQTHGSGMVHITKGRFDATPVELPPLNEQRRIVAAIEEHLSRLDAADSSLAAASDRLEAFASQTVAAALQGDWGVVRLREVTESQVYGTSAKASVEPYGVPVLRMGNINGGSSNSPLSSTCRTTIPMSRGSSSSRAICSSTVRTARSLSGSRPFLPPRIG